MMLRKDRFLAAVFALSVGACGGDAEVEEAETDTTMGDEDPMMDDGMDEPMDEPEPMEPEPMEPMDDGIEEGPLPE